MAYAELKQFLRMNVARPVRRAQALAAWKRTSFDGVPVVFGNSMPKSGSHLLLQLLQGICKTGPFVETGAGPVRTITLKGRMRSQSEISADLRALRPGDVARGYLWSSPENIHLLTRPGWCTYFVLRDPRDMLVSHVFYATDMYEGHGMHKYYQSIPFEQRLKTAIQGIDQDGLHLSNVRARYNRVQGWLNCQQVLLLHFEDLILDRERMLNAMLDHLEQAGYQPAIDRPAALQFLAASVDPKKSPTFRKGKTGGWKEHFTEEHKRLFKDVTGDLLISLGYEKDNNW